MLAEAYVRSGKVRDLYSIPGGRLVLTATDRISAFDVVLPTDIPDKGRVLTGLSRFWFRETGEIVGNHLLDTDVGVLRDAFAHRRETRNIELEVQSGVRPPVALDLDLPLDGLRGRIMICRPTQVLPVEAVVRGYLAGSAWKEYREHGAVCGITLPQGLQESDRLARPIFTPATKAEQGEHDQNITFDGMVEHLASRSLSPAFAGSLAEAVREKAIALYQFGHAVAARRGVILADTKFEFGLAFPIAETEPLEPAQERLRPSHPMAGRRPESDTSLDSDLLLIDEVMTPDSSRFWDAETYEPGRTQASFDKQFVRDWLETQPWDKTAPGPELPPAVVEGTRTRYIEAYERITGASFQRYIEEDVIAA